MKLINFGHSCFYIESNQGTIAFDPYIDGSVPGLTCPSFSCSKLFVSHEHSDHNARNKVIELNNAKIEFTYLKTFHDKSLGQSRGENIIYKVNVDGLIVAHLGDYGDFITDELIDFLSDADIILCPINGFYTIGAKEAKQILDIIKPKIFIPMHYYKNGTGYEDGGQIDIFKSLIKDFVSLNTNEIEISEDVKFATNVVIFERS